MLADRCPDGSARNAARTSCPRCPGAASLFAGIGPGSHSGVPTLSRLWKATPLAALSRAARGPRAVKEPGHARNLHAREPGEPAPARLADHRAGRSGNLPSQRWLEAGQPVPACATGVPVPGAMSPWLRDGGGHVQCAWFRRSSSRLTGRPQWRQHPRRRQRPVLRPWPRLGDLPRLGAWQDRTSRKYPPPVGKHAPRRRKHAKTHGKRQARTG